MNDEERKKKLQAGKERLAQFQKKKARKKQRKSNTPTVGDDCDQVETSTLSGTDSADQSVSSDMQSLSYEESDQGSVGASDLSGDDTSNVDISFEAKVELRHAADEITRLEEQLFGKQAAIDSLSQENEKLRVQLSSQSLNVSSTLSGESILVPEVEEDLRRKVKEYELALAQRDDVLKQLSDSLQAEKEDRNSIEEAYSTQTEQLTQQIHQLQGQMQQAGETLQEQTTKQGLTAETLLGAKTQIVNLQKTLQEKDATLKLLTSKFTDKIEELMNTQEENERLKKSDAQAKAETETLKKSEAEAKATANKLQNELLAFEQSTEELVNTQIELELLKKSEAEARATAERLQSEILSLKSSNQELVNAHEQLQINAAEAKTTVERLRAELETLQESNHDLLNAHDLLKQNEALARASAENLLSELQTFNQTHKMLTQSSNEQIAQIDELKAELGSVVRKEIVIPSDGDKTLNKGGGLIGNDRSEKVTLDMNSDSGSGVVDEEKVVPMLMQSEESTEKNDEGLDQTVSSPKSVMQAWPVHDSKNGEMLYQNEIKTLKEQLDIARVEKEAEIKRLETECESLRKKLGVTAEKSDQVTGPYEQTSQTSAEEISPSVTGATGEAAVVKETKAELVQRIAALEGECHSWKNQLDSAAEGSGLGSDQSRIGASYEKAKIMETELMKINEFVENQCLQFEDEIQALQEECKELKNLNSGLESKEGELEIQCRDLGVKFEETAKSLSDSENFCSDLEEKLDVLGDRCKQLVNEKSLLEASCNDLSEKCNVLETQRQNLEVALSDMESRCRESDNQCLEFQEKCVKLESDKSELDNRLKDNGSVEETVHQLKAQLNEAENRLKDSETKHLDLENRNQKFETECKKLSGQCEESDTHCKDLQTQIDKIEGKTRDLVARCLAFEQQNHELEQMCSDLRGDVSKLSSDLSEKQEKVGKLASDLQISEEKYGSMMSVKDREVEALRADLAQINAKVIEKEIEVVKLVHDLQVMRENANGIVSEKDRQLEYMRVEISQLSGKVSERDDLVEKIAQDLQVAETRHLEVLKERDTEVETLRVDIAKMTSELSEKIQQTEQLIGHLNERENRCSVLQAELEQLQKQLEVVSQEHVGEVTEKDQEIKHLREEVGKRWDALQEKQSAIEKQEIQLKSLTDEIAHYRGQLERLFQGQQAEVENQKEFDKLLDELGTLKQLVHEKECKISEDADTIVGLGKDAENERIKVEEKLKEVEQLEEMVSESEAEIERLSKVVAVMEKSLLGQERMMTETGQKMDSLSSNVTALEAQLQDKEQKILQDAIIIENIEKKAEFKAQLTVEKTAEIEKLKVKELNSQKEIEKLACEVENLQRLVMDKENKIVEATALIEKLGKDVDSERKQVLQKSNEIQKLWDEVRAAKFAIQNKDLAIGGHLQTIDILQKEKEQMSQILNQEHHQNKQRSEAIAQEQNKNLHLSNLLGQEQSQTQGHLQEIRSLQDHLDQSLDDVTQGQQEIQHYRLQIERLLTKKDTDTLLSTEVEKLSADVRDYKEKLGEIRTEKDAILQELDIAKVERDNYKQRLDQVLAEKEKLSYELGSEVQCLKKEIDHYQHDSRDLLEQMSRLNEGHTNEIAMLNEQILSRNDDIGNMRTALEGWSKAYHAMQYNAEQLTIALQQRDSHIQLQGDQIMQQSAQIQAQSSQIETSNQHIQRLEEERDGLGRQFKDLSDKNLYLSNEVEKLQTNIEALYVQLNRFGKEASSPRFQMQADMYDERIQDLIDQLVHKNLCVDAAELEKDMLTDELKAERLKVKANEEMVSALLKSTAEQKAQIKQLQVQVQDIKAEKEEMNCSRLRSESIEAALRAELEKPHVEVEAVSDGSMISNLQAEVSNLKLDKQTANATLQALEVERNHLRTEVQRLGAELEKRKSEEELDVVERILAQRSASSNTSNVEVGEVTSNLKNTVELRPIATLPDSYRLSVGVCSAPSVDLIEVPCEVAVAMSESSFLPSEDADLKKTTAPTGYITDGVDIDVISPAKLAAQELVAIMGDETIPDIDAILNVPSHENISEDDIIPSEAAPVASAIEDSLAILSPLSYSKSDAIVMTPSRSDDELINGEAISSTFVNPEDAGHSTHGPRVPDHLLDYSNYKMLIENLGSEVEKLKKEKKNLESILMKERSVRVAEMVTSNAKIQLLVNDNEAYQVNMALLRDVSREARREKDELERRITGLEFEKNNAVALLKDQGLEEKMEYRMLAESIGSEVQRLREEKEHVLGSTRAASDQVDFAAEEFDQEEGSDTHELTISKLKEMLHEMKKEHSDLKSQLTGLEYNKWNSESILTAEIRKEKAEKDKFRMLAKSLSSELEKRKHERSTLSALSLQEHAGAIVMEAVGRAQVTVLGEDFGVHRDNLFQLKSVVDQCKSDNAALKSKIVVLESALENAESKEKVLQSLNRTLTAECDQLKLHLDQLSEKSQDYVADLVTKQTISYAELRLANTDLDAYKLNLAKLKDLLCQSEAQRSELQRVVNEEIRKQGGMAIEHRTKMSLIASESQAEIVKLRMLLENLSSEHEQLKQKYQSTESSAQRIVAELIAEAVVAVSHLQLELADVDAYKLNLAKLKQLLSDAEKERKVMENSVAEHMQKYENLELESQNRIERLSSECGQLKEQRDQENEKAMKHQSQMGLIVVAETGGEIAKLRMLLENLSSEHEKLKQQAEHTESSAERIVAGLIAEAVVAVSHLQLELADVEAYKLNLAKLKQVLSDSEREKKVLEKSLEEQRQMYGSLEFNLQNQIERLSAECGYLTEQLAQQTEKATEHQASMALVAAESGGDVAKLRMLLENLSSEHEKLKQQAEHTESSAQQMVAKLIAEAVVAVSHLQLELADVEAYKLNLAKLKQLLSDSERKKKALEKSLEELMQKYGCLELELHGQVVEVSSECEKLKKQLEQQSEGSQDMVADLIMKQTISSAELHLANTDIDAYKLNLAKLKDLLDESEAARSRLQQVVNEEIRKQDGLAIKHQARMSIVASESQAEIAKLRMLLENLSSEHEQLKQEYESTEISAQKLVAELIAEAVVAVSQLQLELADVDAYKLNLAKLKQLLSDADGKRKTMEITLEEQMQKFKGLKLEKESKIVVTSKESEQEINKLKMLVESLGSECEKLKHQTAKQEEAAQCSVAQVYAEGVVMSSHMRLLQADVEAYKLNLAKMKELLNNAVREGDRKAFEKETVIFALRKEVAELNSLLKKMRVAFQEEVSEKESDLERLQADLEGKDEEIEILKSKFEEQILETEPLRKHLASGTIEFDQAKSDLANLKRTELEDFPIDSKQQNELLPERLAVTSEEFKRTTENQLVQVESDNLLTKLKESETKDLLLMEENLLLQEDINNLRQEEEKILQTLRNDTDVLTAEFQASNLKCEELEEALQKSKVRESAINSELQKLKVEKESFQRSSNLEKMEGQQDIIEQLRSELVEQNGISDAEREKRQGLQSEITSLQDKYNKLQSDSDGKDRKITELEAKLADFAEQVRELFNKVDGYAAETDILNAQVSNIKSEKEAAEKAYKDEINKQRQELNLEKEEMQEILARHREDIEVFEVEKKKLKLLIGKAAKEKERRKVELSEACAARDEYATTFDSLGQQVSRFQGEVERLEIENESLKSQLKKSRKVSVDIEHLTSQNSTLLAEIEDLELKNQLLESNCNEYLQSCNDLQDESVTQKLTMEKQDELVAELTEQLNGLSVENARLQTDVKMLAEDLSAKEKDVVILRRELAVTKHDFDIQEERIDELRSHLTAGRIDKARSTNDIQDMRDDLSDKEECLTNLLEENEAIKTQLKTYQDQETEMEIHASEEEEELEKNLNEITQELVKLAKEKEELAAEVTMITASKNEYATSLNTLTEQVHGFLSNIERLEIENSHLNSVLANSKEDNVQKIEDLINKNKELSVQVNSFEGTIEKLEQICKEDLQSCNELQEDNINQKLETENERELSNEMRGLLDDLCDVQSQNQTLAADLQRLKEDLSVKEADLIFQQEHVKELTQQLEELTGVRAENQTLAPDLQQFNEDLTIKKPALVSMQVQLDELSGMQAKAKLSEEVLGLQHQLDKSQQETQAVRAELETIQEQLAEFKADKEAMSSYVNDYENRTAKSQQHKEEKEKLTSQIDDLLKICDKYKQEEDDHAADRQNQEQKEEKIKADINTLKADVTNLRADVKTLGAEKKRLEEKCTDLERRHQFEQVKKLGASHLQVAYEDRVNQLVAVEKENKELEEMAHTLKDLCAGFKDENFGLRQSLRESGANISRLEATVRDFEKEFDHAQKEFMVEIKKMKEKMKLEVGSMQLGYDQALENVRRTMDTDKDSLLKIHEEEIETLVKDHADKLERLRKEVEETKNGRKSLEASVKDLQDQKSKIIEDLITSREELNTLKSAYEKDLCEAAEMFEQAQLENRAQQDNYADLATVIESMREKHEEDCKALEKELESRAESEKAHLRDQLRKYEIEVSNLQSGLGSEFLPDDMYILRTKHERFVADQKANYDAVVFGYDAALMNVSEAHADELAGLKMENDQLKIENDQLRAALEFALIGGSILPEDKCKQPVSPYVSFEPEQVLALETMEEQMLAQGQEENICPKSVALEIHPEVVDTVSAVQEPLLGSTSGRGQAQANAQTLGLASLEELIEPEILKDIASEAQFIVAASNEGLLLDGGEATASISDELPKVDDGRVSTDSEQISVAASLEGADGFNPETLETELVCHELEKGHPRSPENIQEEEVMSEQVIEVCSEVPDMTPDEATSENNNELGEDALESQGLGAVVEGTQVEDNESLGAETTDGVHSMDAPALREKLSELEKKLEESDKCITELEEKLKAKDVETATKVEELEKHASALGVDLREIRAECEQLIEQRDTMKVKCEQDIMNFQNEHDTEIQRLKDLVYEYDEVKEKQLEALNAKHMEELEELRFELMQENEEIEAIKGSSLEELLNQERQLRDRYHEELEEVRLELNIQSEEQKQTVEELNEEIEFLKAENEKLQKDLSASLEKIRGLESMLINPNVDVAGDFIPWDEDMQAGEELTGSLSPNAEFAEKSNLQEVFDMEGVPDSPASPFPEDEVWCQKGLTNEPEEMNLVVKDARPANDLKNQIKELEAKHEFEMKQLTEHLKDMAGIEKMRLRAEIELELRDEKRQYKADLDLALKMQLKAMRQQQEMKFIEELQKSRSEMLRKQDDKIEAIRRKFNEQTLHQESVESTDELEEVVQRLQVENQDLLETRHILLDQLDNAHFLKEAQQEQILSLNSNKDNLEEKVLRLQEQLAKYTGESSFEQAAELDKDEWRIKYDRLLSDHEEVLKTNVWGPYDLEGAETAFPKTSKLQELMQSQSADLPVQGESSGEDVDVTVPQPTRVPVWGLSEDLEALVPKSPGLTKVKELPMKEEASVTVLKIPRPVEKLNMTSPLPQNMEGNFCFEDDFNTINKPSFVVDDKEVLEGCFERLEKTFQDPGYSPLEEKRDYTGSRASTSSPSSTKPDGEYVSEKPLDSAESPVDNEGQYISEITQTDNDAVIEGQKQGEFLSESPTDVIKMRDIMYKYARENESLRSEIEALLTNRDAPVVNELKAKVQTLEDKNEAILISYDALEQKYDDVCEELRQLRGDVDEADAEAADGGFITEVADNAGFVPDALATVDDEVGFVPDTDNDLVCPDETNIDKESKSEWVRVKSDSVPAAEIESVPVEKTTDIDYEILEQKYAEVCGELKHLKEQVAQPEPEVGLSAENARVSNAEDKLSNQREENQTDMEPTLNPEPVAVEKHKSVDTGFGSFTPHADVLEAGQEVQEPQADLSPFLPQQKLLRNLREDVLESVQEQLSLSQYTNSTNGLSEADTLSKDLEEKLSKLQNEFEKYTRDSTQSYEELLNTKAELEKVVAKQSVNLSELEGMRRKCQKLDEANADLSDEIIEKEKDFGQKAAAFKKEMNSLKDKLEQLEDANEEMKMKVEELEEQNDDLKRHSCTLSDELGKVYDQNIALQRELDGWASLQEPANPDHIFWPIAGEALAIDEMEFGPSHESSGFDGSSMDAPESVLKTTSGEAGMSIPKKQFIQEEEEDESLSVASEKDVSQDEICPEEQISPEAVPVDEAIVPEVIESQRAAAPIPGRAEELLLTLASPEELEADLSLPAGPEEEQGAPVLMSNPQKNDLIDKSLQDSSEVFESFVTTGQSSQMEDTFATAMTTPTSVHSFTRRRSLGGHSDSTGELLGANCMPDFARSLTDNELSASLQKLSKECEAYKTKQKELEKRVSRCSTPVQELLEGPLTEGTRYFQEEIANLNDDKVELKSLNDGLRDVTDQLRRKIAQLLKKNDDMEIKNMNLEVECEALRTRVNEMEIELDRYFKNNDKLTKKNKDLSLKCNRLETLLADRLSEMKKPNVQGDAGSRRHGLFSSSKHPGPGDVTEDITVLERVPLDETRSPERGSSRKKEQRDEPLSSSQKQGPKEKPRAGVGQEDRREEPLRKQHQDSLERPVVPKLLLDEGDKLQLTERWVSEHSLNSSTEEREITIPLGAGQDTAMSQLDVAQDKYQKDMTRLEDNLKRLEEKLSSNDLNKELTPNGEHTAVAEPSRFYDELKELRRVMQETKEVYNQENSQLKSALDHERFSHLSDITRSSVGGHTPQQMSSLRSNVSHHDTRPHYNYPADYLALREKVAKLQNSNHDLIGQLNDQSRRLHDQEKIVQELKDHLDTSDIVTSEVQQVFTHQLAMLQTQRNFLEKKVQEQRGKDTELADVLGDKLILEETLRREKELLRHIMHEKAVQEIELMRSKLVLEEKERGHRRLQNLLKEKDRLEADLVQQKQTLQDELSSIEGSLISRSGRNRQERNQALNDWQAPKGPHYRTSTPAKASVSLDSTIQSPSAMGGAVHSAAGDFEYQHSVLSIDSTRSDQENVRRLRRLRMESELCSERAVERLKSRYDTVRLNKEHSTNVLQWRNSRRPNNTYSSF